MSLNKRNPQSGTLPGNSQRSFIFGVCFVLAGLILAAFGRAIHYPYVVLDDLYYLSKNNMVQTGLNARSLYWAFTTFQPTGDWQPLTWLSWMIPAQFFGLSPVVSHSINILLHMANSILLFLILRKYTGVLWRSALVAVLFAVHPMRVESVVWAAERKDVLAGFFWMLTMSAYFEYTQKPSVVKMFWTSFLFLLGLMSKPALVTLPFIFLLLDDWPLKRFEPRPGKLVLEKIPLFLLSIFSSVMSCVAVRPYIMGFGKISLRLRVINAIISYGDYLKKTFWPYPLANYYPHPMEHYSKPMLGFSVLILVLFTVLAFRLRRKAPSAIVGWLWFLGALFPMAGLVQVGRAAMADRYTYFPHIGLFIALVWLLPEIKEQKQVKISGMEWKNFLRFGILILPLLAASYIQTGYWRDAEVLDRHTLKVTGVNPIVQSNLEYAVVEKKMEKGDVAGLLNFFAESSGVKIPSSEGESPRKAEN